MELIKFAAIDIGTNAVRLLITNILKDKSKTYFKKASLTRMPVRLGADVFSIGEIGKDRKEKLFQIMQAFNLLMKSNDVVHYRACATSAMREASNGKEIIECVKKNAGVNIEIISGDEEAEIIRNTQINDLLKNGKNWLFIDVGGGSTEITLFENGKPVKAHSFKIGTIRIIKNKAEKEEFEKLKNWLENIDNSDLTLNAIGSGGNINKMFKFSQKKEGKVLYFNELRDIYKEIYKYSYEERMKILGFNPDRADVIIPAAEIFINIMQKVGIGKIYVPKIGLADGIIQTEFKKYGNSYFSK